MKKRMPKEGAAGRRRERATLPGKAVVTYPYWLRLKTFLARQDPHSGLTEGKLESTYLSQGAGKPDRTGVAPLPGIDVEKLSEEEIKALVTNWASGHKIEYLYDPETGKEEPHVLMHSLTPNLMCLGGEVVAVEEHKASVNKTSGQRIEVNIFYVSMCFNTIYVGSCSQRGGEESSPSDQKEDEGGGKEGEEGAEVGAEENQCQNEEGQE